MVIIPDCMHLVQCQPLWLSYGVQVGDSEQMYQLGLFVLSVIAVC